MDVLDCIKTRRSIRKYLDVPVEFDKLTNIVDAARFAPSSGNVQNWKFIVVFDKGKRKKLAEACLQQFWMEQAPVHIIVCGEPEKARRFYGIRGERLYTIQNCATAIQNILLTAHSLGLGACWVGAFDEDMIKRDFGIPDNVRPQAIITIGYADEDPPAPPKYKIEFMFFFQSWRARIKDAATYFGWTSVGFEKAFKEGTESGKGILKKASEKIAEKSQKIADKIKKVAKKNP